MRLACSLGVCANSAQDKKSKKEKAKDKKEKEKRALAEQKAKEKEAEKAKKVAADLARVVGGKLQNIKVSMELVAVDARLAQVPSGILNSFTSTFEKIKTVLGECEEVMESGAISKLSISAAKEAVALAKEGAKLESLVKAVFAQMARI